MAEIAPPSHGNCWPQGKGTLQPPLPPRDWRQRTRMTPQLAPPPGQVTADPRDGMQAKGKARPWPLGCSPQQPWSRLEGKSSREAGQGLPSGGMWPGSGAHSKPPGAVLSSEQGPRPWQSSAAPSQHPSPCPSQGPQRCFLFFIKYNLDAGRPAPAATKRAGKKKSPTAAGVRSRNPTGSRGRVLGP